MKNLAWGALVMTLLAVWTWLQMPGEDLRLVFCDVGQGDGAVVVLGYFQALIDTGESEGKILKCLENTMPYWDKKIELVFISHPDKDHAGALSGVERVYEVEKIIRKADRGDVVRFGNLQFEILNRVEPDDEECKGTNGCSLVVKLVYGKFSGLFTGDIGEQQELALIDQGVIDKVDILKVPHHGSKFSSSIKFLEALRPSLAVISVGAKNSYGHPTSDTLMRLDAVGAKIMRTDQEGTIKIETDGEKTWVVKK